MMQDFKSNMPLTLEMHLNDLGLRDLASKELVSLYNLLKKRISARLINTRTVFVEYSLHDASHSRTIIRAIERFLGESRIKKLSATDTFMLLVCAYAHDYGMAKTYDKIYEMLGSKAFKEYLDAKDVNHVGLDEDDIDAIQNLKNYMDGKKPNIPLNWLYRSIIHVIQMYLRPLHADGVFDIKEDFAGLFGEDLRERFIFGSEGIVEICMCHGKDFESIFELSQHADGIIGDDFHPRFIATMIRLGDLLDLDNGRFPEWFLKELSNPKSIISEQSKIHARKHQAITHLLITDTEITVEAHCEPEKPVSRTAMLVSEWTDTLKEECKKLVIHWSKIAQPDFGLPPGNVNIRILVDKKEYSTVNQVFQLKMSQQKAMELLEGTSIYQNQYVGIRELLQNAVDASLLQLWMDIKQNRYKSLGISKKTIQKEKLTLTKFAKINGLHEIFSNYDITIELIKNLDKERVELVIKDRGIGISKDDVDFIADIGSSENNINRKKLIDEMPNWLKPAGIFGIGLQSVFQITDCIEFYTRQHNLPERRIALYSYARSRGRIEISEVPPNKDGLYNDNSIPGTNAKIIINRNKFSFGKTANSEPDRKHLMYYDEEFDREDDLDILYGEVCQACKAIVREVKKDYFNVHLQELTIIKEDVTEEEGGTIPGRLYHYYRRSYFSRDYVENDFGYSARPLFVSNGKSLKIENSKAYYWDECKNRAYRLEVRPCIIKERSGYKRVHLPQKTSALYKVSYKFNKITQSESIYSHNDSSQSSHAGFLMWNIQILDYPPTKYLNIDRDRLRKDAIKEEELLEIRNIILEEWCIELVGNVKKAKFLNNDIGLLLSFIILFYQNVKTELFERFIAMYGGILKENDLFIGFEKIPIMTIWEKDAAFYADQMYIDSHLTNSSEKTGENDSDGNKIHEKEDPELQTTVDVSDEEIKTNLSGSEGNAVAEDTQQERDDSKEKRESEQEADLQNCKDEDGGETAEKIQESINMSTSEDIDQEMTDGEEEQYESVFGHFITMETVRHFPHRIVHPQKIVTENSELGILRYHFRFGVGNTNDNMIIMDDYSRAVDYTLSMSNMNSKADGFSFLDISKSVFKPDAKYKHLIVTKYPYTFHKSHNFSNYIDECIHTYILSPFAEKSSHQHRTTQDGSKENKDIRIRLNDIVNGSKVDNSIEDFIKQIETTKRFKKCIEYAINFGANIEKDMEEGDYRNLVQNEYKEFIREFCRIMICYKKEMLTLQREYSKRIKEIFT